MEVGFKHQKAHKPEPVRIEQVFAEKPGGGLVANPDYDVPPTSAVQFNKATGLYEPMKCFKLVASVVSADTTIKIAKDSGIAVGDVIGHGKLGVACTAVDKSNEGYDLVTVSLGVDINIDTEDPWLYQAKEESVVEGYYDADASDADKLLIVANDSQSVGDGEIMLEDVTPYHGSRTLEPGMYVALKEEKDAELLIEPEYITGKTDWVYAGEGDQSVKLINGANVRKETANISAEVEAKLKSIKRV